MLRQHQVKRGTILLAWWSMVVACDLTAQQERRWSIQAAPETEIGDALGDDAYIFQSIAAARLLPDGRIVVADKAILDIRMYGKDGKFQKRIGRRGSGPGEFQHIGGLWLTSKGMIAVWDGKFGRITLFNSQGERESTQTLRGNPASRPPEIYFGSFSNDDIVLVSLIGGRRGPEVVPDRWVLGRFGLDGEFKGALGEARGMWRYNGNPIPFSPLPHTVLHRDSLYIVDDYGAELTVRDGRGAVSRKLSLPPARQVTVDAAWSGMEAEMRQRAKSASGSGAKLFIDHLDHGRLLRPNQFPQIGGLITDDRGYIWAKTYDPSMDPFYLKTNAILPAAGGEWRVIRTDGGLVATVRLPATVRPLEIKGDRLIGVAVDELGVEKVVVHAIQR